MGLRFEGEDGDRGGDFTARPTPDNALSLEGSAGATWVFLVDVSLGAVAGPVSLNAHALGLRFDASVFEVLDARATDAWSVSGAAGLLVTTAIDEDDTGGQTTVEAAGGAGDLSLREALLIANAAPVAEIIRFDPAVFPEAGGVQLALAPGLGALPAITKAGSVIDGSGAGVVISGAGLSDAVGLQIQADEVTLQALTLSGFSAGGAKAVASSDVHRVSLIGCVFLGNGAAEGGSQVRLAAGSGRLLEGCVFANNGGTGAVGYSVTSGVELRDNSFVENGSVHDSSGLMVIEQASAYLIERNSFVDNDHRGVYLRDTTVGGITLRANHFGDHDWGEIRLGEGANEGLEPPEITSFDRVHLEGLAPGAAEVEVYSALEALSPLTTAPVTAGAFSLDLDEAVERVRVLATTAAGSTSPFSAAQLAPAGELVVSTTEDELDGGGRMATVAAAGGVGDLSLREALTIANNRVGSSAISFAPAVFPPQSETTILVGGGSAGAEPLPTITHRGLVIDGAGAGVVLDGSGLQFPESSGLLKLSGAHGCELRDLALRNYNSHAGGCVYLHDSENLQVSGCDFSGCGDFDNGVAVWASSHSDELQVSESVIRGGRRGVYFDYTVCAMVSGNRFEHVEGSGVQVYRAEGVSVIDNDFFGCGTGVNVGYDSRNNLVLGNRAWAGGVGFRAGSDAYGTAIYFNSAVGLEVGLRVSDSADHTTLTNNLAALNSACGLELSSSGVVSAGHGLFFNNAGDALTGASAVCGGVLDATDLLADPLLVDPASGDLTPRAAAIDAAPDLGYDRNGALPGLFNGAAPDIGAVETP